MAEPLSGTWGFPADPGCFLCMRLLGVMTRPLISLVRNKINMLVTPVNQYAQNQIANHSRDQPACSLEVQQRCEY